MFATNSLRSLVYISVGFAFASLLAFAAFSTAASATHSWNGYHWARQSNPFTLQLGDNVSLTWDSYLSDASGPNNSINDWGDSSVLDTMIVGGTTNPKTCRPRSGRVEVCNEKYGTNGWLGVAQIWLSGKHIVQGTTKLNDTYFNRAKYNTPGWRHLVMCQEIGHTFGLDHQDENHANTNLGTCMDYTNDPTGTAGTNGTLSNEYPNAHDYDELATIYKHLDSSTTVGTNAASKMPPAANRGDFGGRAEWGQLKQRSPDGQLELWERDFGGGAKLITWVIRA